MAELEWQATPERASLRRALRHALRRHVPSLRVVAEDFLAESTPIDLLAVGAEGELVSVRIGEESIQTHLFTRAMADLAWLGPRVMDLSKLAPGLGLEPSAEPRALIFCPLFSSETRLAAESLPTRSLELFQYRNLRQQGQLVLLLERCKPVSPPEARSQMRPHRRDFDRLSVTVTDSSTFTPDPEPSNPPLSKGPSRVASDPLNNLLAAAPNPSGFRTGLTDADLQLEPAASPGHR